VTFSGSAIQLWSLNRESTCKYESIDKVDRKKASARQKDTESTCLMSACISDVHSEIQGYKRKPIQGCICQISTGPAGSTRPVVKRPSYM